MFYVNKIKKITNLFFLSEELMSEKNAGKKKAEVIAEVILIPRIINRSINTGIRP